MPQTLSRPYYEKERLILFERTAYSMRKDGLFYEKERFKVQGVTIKNARIFGSV